MTETPRHPPRTGRGGVALVLASVSLALSLVFCAVVGLIWNPNEWDPLPVQSKPRAASAAQVEAIAHVTLPPGTVLLTAAYSSGLETRLSAKVRITRAQLDVFITAAEFTATLTPGLRAVTAAHNVGGGDVWDPEAATTVGGIDEQEPANDGTRRMLLVDLDVPDVVTIYLYASRN